jgi:hypothetical protein
MKINDLHCDIYVVAGDDFFRKYEGGESIMMPVGVSSVASRIPDSLKIEYNLYGWNLNGDRFEWERGEIPARAEPFSFIQLTPVSLKLPGETSLMIFATTLKDGKGNILQHNFVPFRVEGRSTPDQYVISQPPSAFTDASWSIKHLAPQQGRKVWGMGSGYFQYEFSLPAGLDSNKIGSAEFRAELSARYPKEKYLEEGEAESIGMTVVSNKGTIPGYSKNSYPQTDEKTFSSTVVITANGQKISETFLPDDPADHRGLLSWMNQEPGWSWGSRDRSKRWLLDEAGSFGYLVTSNIDKSIIGKAIKSGKVIIRLQVNDSGPTKGGLSVYGKESGRFPLNPSLILKPE